MDWREEFTVRRIVGVIGLVVVGMTALGASHATSHTAVKTTAAVVPARNPLLPQAVRVEGFFPDLSLVQKLPTMTPGGFEPLYSGLEWAGYRAKFGAEEEQLPRKKSSGQIEFAQKLIDEAEKESKGVDTGGGTVMYPLLSAPGIRRLMLLRAAAISYRSNSGFPTANKAVEIYQKRMDINSAAQVGALWTIANQMSRMSVTPKAERIRYSGIAARANMQLALLLVEADQIEAAQNVIKMVGYHEGWLKSDGAMRAAIAQTRAVVKQTAVMMDYLGTQYRPAIEGDDGSLMALYLYGMFVKKDPGLVADFPSRKPTSAMAQLAGTLSRGRSMM